MRRRFVWAAVAGLYVVCSTSLATVSCALDRALAQHHGLTQSVSLTSTGVPFQRQVSEIELHSLDAASEAGLRPTRVTWAGLWHFPADAAIDLRAWSDDRVRWTLDGKSVVEHNVARDEEPTSRRLFVTAGFHDLAVTYDLLGGGHALHVQWAPVGQDLGPLPADRLFRSDGLAQAQRAVAVRRVARTVWLGVPLVLLLALIAWWAMRATARAVVPPESPRVDALSTRAVTILVSAALVIAALTRYWGIDFGLPHTRSRPDEEFSIAMALRFMQGHLDPDFFIYPPLYAYGLTVVYAVYYAWGYIGGGFEAPIDVAASWHSYWEPFFLLSRIQSAALGTATVLVIYRMGLRLFDRDTAVVSAFLLALAFLHARDSHFGTVDVAVTLLVLLSIHYLMRARQRPEWRAFVGAGALGGLAMATKYNAALVCVPFAADVALHVFKSRGARVRAAFDRRIVFFALPLTLVFLIAAPYSLLGYERFIETVQAIRQGLGTGAGFADLGDGWTHHARWTLRYGLGVPLLVASLAGLVAAARKDWRQTLVLCAFPLAFYAMMGSYHWVFARYMVPVVPFLCLFAAVGIVWMGRQLTSARPGLPRAVVTVGLTIVVLVPSASSLLQLDRLLARTDSRVVAARWVREHVPAGSTIAQNGGVYGQVQFDRRDRYDEWSETQVSAALERDTGQRGHTDWIILYSSPLGRDVAPSVAALVSERYELAEVVKGSGSATQGNEFDLQDAFFVPYAGFRDVVRPGPDIRIYRKRPGGAARGLTSR